MTETVAGKIEKELSVLPVETKLIRSDETIRSPFKLEPVLAVSAEENPNLPRYLIKLTKEHGRSTVDNRVYQGSVWFDQNNIPFGVVDYKGNNAADLGISKDEFEGWRVNGLKTLKSSDRIIETSQFMRSHGLPTEAIANARQIQELPGKDGKMVSIEEWKGQQIEMAQYRIKILQDRISNMEMNDPEYNGLVIMKEDEERNLPEIIKFLDKNEFMIMERHLQVDVRLRDLLSAKTKEEFLGLAKDAFVWFDKINRIRKETPGFIGWPFDDKNKFDPENEGHLRWFFGSWLPTQMGQYLARMHNSGLSHNFAHTQNWELIGVLCDLDGVRGAMSKDPKPTTKEFRNDVAESMNALLDMAVEREGDEYGTFIKSLAGDSYVAKVSNGLVPEMKINFMASYLRNSYNKENLQKTAGVLVDSFYPTQIYTGVMKETGPAMDASLKIRLVNKLVLGE